MTRLEKLCPTVPGAGNAEAEQTAPHAITSINPSLVLTRTLEMPDDVLAEGRAVLQTVRCTVAEHGEILRPSLRVFEPGGEDDFFRARPCPRRDRLQ